MRALLLMHIKVACTSPSTPYEQTHPHDTHAHAYEQTRPHDTQYTIHNTQYIIHTHMRVNSPNMHTYIPASIPAHACNECAAAIAHAHTCTGRDPCEHHIHHIHHIHMMHALVHRACASASAHTPARRTDSVLMHAHSDTASYTRMHAPASASTGLRICSYEYTRKLMFSRMPMRVHCKHVYA